MDDCERGPYYRALDDVLLHQAQMTVRNGPVPPQPVVELEIPGARFDNCPSACAASLALSSTCGCWADANFRISS